MARQSLAAQWVTVTYNALIRMDFDPILAAHHLSRTNTVVQQAMGDLVLHLVNIWAAELPRSTKNHPLYRLYEQAAMMVGNQPNVNPSGIPLDNGYGGE